MDWAHCGNVYWQHSVARHESCRVTLHGHAEFEARDVTLRGDLDYVVPDGMRMLVTPGAGGGAPPVAQLLPLAHPSWGWRYDLTPSGAVRLELEEEARA